MNLPGFTHLTYDEWMATSVVTNPTKVIHTCRPSDKPVIPPGHQKDGEDIYDWLGVEKPEKRKKSKEVLHD